MGMLERRPAGSAVIDGHGRIVLDAIAPSGASSTRRRVAPVVSDADVDLARQQLATIGKIKKGARRGGLLMRLAVEDERRHRKTVSSGAYRQALLSAAASRQRRSADDHLDVAVGLLQGLGDHHRDLISLSADDRRVILDGVTWHQQQARGAR